jgi:hypothetical protein
VLDYGWRTDDATNASRRTAASADASALAGTVRRRWTSERLERRSDAWRFVPVGVLFEIGEVVVNSDYRSPCARRMIDGQACQIASMWLRVHPSSRRCELVSTAPGVPSSSAAVGFLELTSMARPKAVEPTRAAVPDGAVRLAAGTACEAMILLSSGRSGCPFGQPEVLGLSTRSLGGLRVLHLGRSLTVLLPHCCSDLRDPYPCQGLAGHLGNPG